MKPTSIGILGLGSNSTLFYIKELNALYNKEHNGFSTCPFKMLNTNFNSINQLLPNTSKKLDGIVKDYIDELIALVIDSILVPNITLHETIDRLNISTKIIHPVYCTISELQQKNHKKIVLLGSKHTMKSDYIKSKFTDNNLEVLLPTDEEILFIDELRKQVYHNKETENILEEFNKLIHQYAQENAVVIACTELSIALTIEHANVFDMARIQIKQALNQKIRY